MINQECQQSSVANQFYFNYCISFICIFDFNYAVLIGILSLFPGPSKMKAKCKQHNVGHYFENIHLENNIKLKVQVGTESDANMKKKNEVGQLRGRK